MTLSLTTSQIAQGWVEEINGDRAKQLGVADGSFAVYYRDLGRIHVEILPPLSPEVIEDVKDTRQEFQEAFEEMKRLGD